MKIFHCYHCQNLVFFESFRCVACGHALGFLPDLLDMGSLEPAGGLWESPHPVARGRAYRLCANYERENVCNWAVPADDPDPLCESCRLTRVIPDMSVPGNKEAWYKVEAAKRRLIFSLLTLRLPLEGKSEDFEAGLAFELLADAAPGAAPVLTGHNQGVITLNVAEADDAQREKRRALLHEPYRTLLGHFRHEIGHYYWDRLVAEGPELEGFRRLFGDERQPYDAALQRHYAEGAPADWQGRFLSAYASAHPWEDWAETWAHYLHMADSLETAAACGLSLKPKRSDEPSLKSAKPAVQAGSFEKMVEAWFSLTYVLNSLNRGLGLPDGYPFVLSAPALEKLRFVHEVIARASGSSYLSPHGQGSIGRETGAASDPR